MCFKNNGYNFSVAEEEETRETLIRNQIDFSVKHAHFKKNKVCY